MSEPLLAGRYALGAVVGSGGSADVYAATDVHLRRAVAVKVVRVAGPGPEPAAELVHPHIVRVLDAGTDPEGRPFVVLDLVVGRTLARLVADGPVDAGTALQVLDAVLAGLEHAHAHGVLHLDLSPANVMVPDDRGPAGAVVLDLGTSRRRPDAVTVSPQYASPEVATAGPVDGRADVYSAGALLFHLVTGEPLFDGPDPQAILAAQVDRPAPIPGDLPPDIVRILRRALAKEPSRRFPDAAAMRQAVAGARAAGTRQGAGRTAPVATTKELLPVRPADLPVRRPSRAPAVLVGLAIIAVAVVLVLASTRTPATTTADQTPVATVATTTVAAPPPPPTEVRSVPVETAAAVQVPELTGLTLEDARSRLAALGLVLGDVTPVDVPSATDTVLDAAPPPGAAAEPGSSVSLRVASGLSQVPDVSGRSAADAHAALAGAGFAAIEREVPGATTGLVVGTDPSAASRGQVGGTVILLVGRVPEPTPTPTPTPTSTPSPSPSPTP